MAFTFDESAFRRTERAVVDAENRPQRATQPPSPRGERVNRTRFRLLEDLHAGGQAIAMPAVLDSETGLDLPSGASTVLIRSGGNHLFLPKGSDVSAVQLDGYGWLAITGGVVGWGVDENDIPFGVKALSPSSTKLGAVRLQDPIGDAPWLHDFAFLPQGPFTLQRDGADADGTISREVMMCPIAVDGGPNWAAYEQDVDSSIPEEITNALGISATDPTPGEYWGVRVGSNRLTRSISYQRLWWYKWSPPERQCVPNEFAASPANVWEGTQLSCDPNDPYDTPPDADNAICWVSTHGWWNWGGWGWGGWNPGWYGYGAPYWAGWPSTWAGYWGGWGYGWWNWFWGGKPPMEDQLIDEDDPVPQPSYGTITREKLYGYIYWQWGWRVLSVDTDRQIAHVLGPGRDFTFFNGAVVVDDESPCEES